MNVLIKIYLGHEDTIEIIEKLIKIIADALIELGYDNPSEDEDGAARSFIVVDPITDLTDEDWISEQVKDAVIVAIPTKEKIESV